MSTVPYQPDRGHFVWIDCSPHAGTEQGGRRPALILSPLIFNVGTGLVVACPITNQVKGGPFEIPLPKGMCVTGVLLSDHVRTMDWMHRNIDFIGIATTQCLDEVMARFTAIISG